MKYGRSLQELAIELDRQAKVKKDYVATAGAMQMTAVNENFDLVIGNTPFQLNENLRGWKLSWEESWGKAPTGKDIAVLEHSSYRWNSTPLSA